MQFWLGVALFSLGLALGIFLGAKYASGYSYSFGKVKVKGQGNRVTTELDTNDAPSPGENRVRKHLFKKIFNRGKIKQEGSGQTDKGIPGSIS